MKETDEEFKAILDDISKIQIVDDSIHIPTDVGNPKVYFEKGISFDTIEGIGDKPGMYVIKASKECISLIKDMILVMTDKVSVNFTPINRLTLIKITTDPYSFIQLTSNSPTDIVADTITVFKTSNDNEPLKEGDKIVLDRMYFRGQPGMPSPMELGMLPVKVFPYSNVVISDKIRRLRNSENAIVSILFPIYRTIEYGTIEFHYIKGIIG